MVVGRFAGFRVGESADSTADVEDESHAVDSSRDKALAAVAAVSLAIEIKSSSRER